VLLGGWREFGLYDMQEGVPEARHVAQELGAARVVEVVQAGYDRVRQQQAVARQELHIANDCPARREPADDRVIGAATGELYSVGDHRHAFDSFGQSGSRRLQRACRAAANFTRHYSSSHG